MLTLFWLIFGHYIADFALQTDFMAKSKCPGKPNWIHAMVAHCAIHSGMVMLATGNWWGAYVFSGVEFVSHFLIDSLKGKKALTLTQDQLLHLTMKVLYVGVILFVRGGHWW